MAETWNWRTAARCRLDDADDLFVRGRHQQDARRFCEACPVRTECLAHALDNRVEGGVWGGMTERQRRALLRERPRVRSWAELLCAARRAHYSDIAARTGRIAERGGDAHDVSRRPGVEDVDTGDMDTGDTGDTDTSDVDTSDVGTDVGGRHGHTRAKASRGGCGRRR